MRENRPVNEDLMTDQKTGQNVLNDEDCHKKIKKNHYSIIQYSHIIGLVLIFHTRLTVGCAKWIGTSIVV